MKRADVKTGMKLQLSATVIATVTGETKHGFSAIQEYKGKSHKITIPFCCLDNNHYKISEVV